MEVYGKFERGEVVTGRCAPGNSAVHGCPYVLIRCSLHTLFALVSDAGIPLVREK
jgi:hypothetical protein